VDRLNALMVVTPQASYLETLQTWIERLDVPTEGGGRRLYVYRVQNVRAADLAGILRDVFSLGQAQAVGRSPGLAPGATPRIIQTRPDETPEEMAAAVRAVGVIQGADQFDQPVGDAASTTAANNGDAGTVGNVSIIADDTSNTLVVLASPGDYSRIESAIRQLDVMPLQVLLETTIVEVSLTGELSYGMQWFFDHNTDDSRSGIGSVGLPLSFPGTFSYSIVNSADEVRAILRILATEDRLRVVSAPSVLVLDNQTANIRVGNQQPVSTAIVAEGGIVSTSVQFKNTGITLDVTPRVNASGLVTLEVSQELTDVGQIDDATGQRAFLQRSIGSNVAVNNGQTIVLGGLIRENDVSSRSGVPFLHKIPVLGGLFGQRVNTNDRTELLVLLTATVIQNVTEAQGLIEEFRRKMPSLFPMPSGFSPASLTEDANETTEPSADATAVPTQPAPEPDETGLERP
jgi:general secretion pathway protein D